MNTQSVKGVVRQDAQTPFDQTRSLYHYLGILRNRRWFLTGVVSLCLLVAFVASFVFPYEYRAKTTVQIEPERADFYANWRRAGSYAEYKSHYLTQLETLTSNGLVRRVIEDLNLWEHDEFTPVWKRALGLVDSENAVIETFRDRIGVSAVQGSMLLTVQFAASDPNLASIVLNALVDRFTSEHGESKRELTVRASDWMSEKIPLLNASLAKAEQKMDAFRREHDLVNVEDSVSRLSEMELSQASLELAQTRSELTEAMLIFEDMSDPAETGVRLESLEMVRNDPLVQQAWIHKNGALNHKQKLAIKYGHKHPYMIDANARLASLDAEIAEQIDRIMSTAANRVELLNKRLSIAESRVDDNKQDVLSIQEKRFKLGSLERDVMMQRKLADQFYADTVAARSLAGFDVGSAVVVDPAVAPLQPYRPQRLIVLMLVALSSSIFSVLFVFIYEHVDDKIRNTRDVADKLGMGLLGVMPEFTSTGLVIEPGKSREPARMYQHSDVVAEAVNNVRTSLMTHSSRRVREASVLLVTASQAGEGSTTAAIALAHSFARLERVLLIDCHLRRPAVAQLDTDNDAGYGLNSLIAGTSSIEDSVRRDVFGGDFDVLACAPDVARSTAILASSQFAMTLDQLREQYEWIILDAAPTQRDSSSLVLGRLADAVVYVVKSHSTRLTAILRGVRRLRAANGCIAGVLINRVDPKWMVSRGGDYDYASYSGDISYKERNAWDVVRETLHVVTDRVRVAYREYDAAKTWDKVNSMVLGVTQLARTAHNSIRELHKSELGQRFVGLIESARVWTHCAQARCRNADLSGLRERAEPYRQMMVSLARYIGDRARILPRDGHEPLYVKASRALVHMQGAVARRAEGDDVQTLSRK